MRVFFVTLLLSGIFAADYLLLKIDASAARDNLTDSDIESINTLFSEEFNQYGSVENLEVLCSNNECALLQLSNGNSTYAVYTKLMKLGSKIIYTGYLLNNETTFSSKVTALSVEDMEAAVARLAKSLALQESIDAVVDIDNIVESEQMEDARRQSLGRVGLSVGYMYPISNSYAIRSGGDYDYSTDDYSSGETRYDSQKIKFSTNYFYEFKENTALLSEITWYTGAPFSWGADLSMIKYLNKDDTSPFIGGGVGLHWVSYCGDNCYDVDRPDSHKRSGPTFNIQGGYVLFRTYNVNVMARARYHLILNTDIDQGFTVDIGVERKRPPREHVENNPMRQVATGIGYFYLGILFLGLLANS